MAARMLTGNNNAGATKMILNNRFDGQFHKGSVDYTSSRQEFLDLAEYKKPNKNYSLIVSSVSSHSSGSTGYGTEEFFRGVAARHAYTVMGVRAIDGEKMIVLRNPWGFGGTNEYYIRETGGVSTKLQSDASKGSGYLFFPVDTFFRTFSRYYVANM